MFVAESVKYEPHFQNHIYYSSLLAGGIRRSLRFPTRLLLGCEFIITVMNGYELSRQFFDWCFENPEKVKPNHVALFFFAIEHCNRLGWKEKFGLPTSMVKEAIGIRSYNTYINTLKDLIDWGFISLIEKSKNQYSSNIIALSGNNKAHDKALDKALIKHSTKHMTKHSESTVQSISSIDKQGTIEQETRNKEQDNNIDEVEILSPYSFSEFWELYDKKVGKKDKIEKKWNKLSEKTRKKIIDYIPYYRQSQPEKQFRKNPETFLNNESWNDEIITKNTRKSVFADIRGI